MPIYEFRCVSCGHVFEELVFRRSEIEELVCPKCGTPRITQLMSACNSAPSSSSGSAGSSGGCGSGSFS